MQSYINLQVNQMLFYDRYRPIKSYIEDLIMECIKEKTFTDTYINISKKRADFLDKFRDSYPQVYRAVISEFHIIRDLANPSRLVLNKRFIEYIYPRLNKTDQATFKKLVTPFLKKYHKGYSEFALFTIVPDPVPFQDPSQYIVDEYTYWDTTFTDSYGNVYSFWDYISPTNEMFFALHQTRTRINASDPKLSTQLYDILYDIHSKRLALLASLNQCLEKNAYCEKMNRPDLIIHSPDTEVTDLKHIAFLMGEEHQSYNKVKERLAQMYTQQAMPAEPQSTIPPIRLK